MVDQESPAWPPIQNRSWQFPILRLLASCRVGRFPRCELLRCILVVTINAHAAVTAGCSSSSSCCLPDDVEWCDLPPQCPRAIRTRSTGRRTCPVGVLPTCAFFCPTCSTSGHVVVTSGPSPRHRGPIHRNLDVSLDVHIGVESNI